MPKIIPFRSTLYSRHLRSDLKNLIAPPYDVISEDGLKALRNRHPHNAVKLSLVENADDPDRYKKMKALYEAWKAEGVFEKDEAASFYLIEELFSIGGKPQKRIGFVALMEISSFEERKVLPHEHTLAGPKKDRFELLKEMGAELSQVFLCYRDPSLLIETIYRSISQMPPLLEAPEVDHISRRVWPIRDSKMVASIQALIDQQSVLIADGHHRYETSVAFRDFDKTPKSKYVQVYLTNLESPGFSIQPIHRLFSLPESFATADFLKRLEKTFRLEPASQIDPEALTARRSKGEISFFLQLKDENKIFLASRRAQGDEDAEIFALQKEIFEEVLGWDVSKTSYGVLKYEHELNEFQKTLAKLPRGIGVFLPPTDLNLVMKRALRGERMPQKSTYFYPKIASGLINYELGSF